MLIYAHNVETKGKQKLPEIKKQFSLVLLNTVKPVLSGHGIKRTPSIKRTVAKVPKFISLIYFK